MLSIKRSELPIVLGALMAGGFFTGVIQVGDQQFAVVTAPKDGGDLVGQYGTYREDIQGATSVNDGLANTNALAAAGSDLAKRIRALRIAGFDDWYLPARDELELQYRAFKPTDETNDCSFRDGENPSSVPPGHAYTPDFPGQTSTTEAGFEETWYWSSTQSSQIGAWGQGFDDGGQGYGNKNNEGRARAVRRILIVD